MLKNKLKVIILTAGIFISHIIFAQNLMPFNTKDLPKANGLDITIKYPSDWRQEDASRLNVITKFTKKYSGENLGMMMLGVYDLEPSVFKALNNGSTDVWRQLNSANNIKVLNIIKTKKEGRDIYFSETKNTFAGPEFTITMRYKEMQLLYKEKLLTLTCGVIVRNSPPDNELEQSLNKVTKDCQEFFNSLDLIR